MATTLIHNTSSKKVSDPNFRYESLIPFYQRARAIIGGEHAAKNHDHFVDTINYSNLLIPFSANMTQQQFAFYKAEAELPGLCSQYTRVLVAGLLRKRPDLVLPEDAPEGAYEWIIGDFTKEHGSLIGFLANALEEEITSSRAWVGVNYPKTDPSADLTPEQRDLLRPFPILYKAESIINWKEGIHPVTGESGLQMVIVRQNVEKAGSNEFHADIVDTVWVHDLDGLGQYRVRVYERPLVSEGEAEAGEYKTSVETTNRDDFVLQGSGEIPLANGEPLKRIPMYPLNGAINGSEPLLMPLIDREVGLYNKVSRRNHLMYGAATFTPVIESDMMDEEVDEIAEAGLGSWLRVRVGEKISVLETPTDALKDMDRAIQDTLMEIARMGIRMMAPDVRDQSGAALEIKNAHMTAQLSTLNILISQTMRTVISIMLNWRYDTEYKEEDIHFDLSPDFNPVPLGADWLRLVTEWYDTGKIPRSTWLEILKANDIMPSDYNDENAKEEIENDDLVLGPPKAEQELDLEKTEETQRIMQNFRDEEASNSDSNSTTNSSNAGGE